MNSEWDQAASPLEISGTAMHATDLTPLLKYLAKRTGLCIAGDRGVAIGEGIRRAMRNSGIHSANDFLARIEVDQAAFDDLVAQVTVGETYFNREPDQFEAIRKTLIPEIQSRKGYDHFIRFWSAACSTGEEAWSLAMQCGHAGLLNRCHILATDISRESLQTAERGEYRKWSIRSPSMDFADTYLQQATNGWRIVDSLRNHVVFNYLNLALDNYPSMASGTWGMDIILCRNVLIYFDRQTVNAVVRRLYESLSPGGWLVLASTDPSPIGIAPFEMVECGRCLVYRRPVSPPPVTVEPEPILEVNDEWIFEEPEVKPVDSTIVRSGDVAIQDAQDALRLGDLQRVRELTAGRTASPVASSLLVRALASQDMVEAERVCGEIVQRHPTSAELHYLHAILLLDLDRYRDAERAVRKTLFLDRSLAIGHFTLGVILQRSGQREGAVRSFSNTRRLCEGLPAETLIPLSDGEHAGRLVRMAAQHIAMLSSADVNRPG